MFKQLIYLISFLSLVAVLPAGATETEKDQRKFDYFFYEGLNLKNAGKFDAAYDAFNHCLEIDSTAAPVLYLCAAEPSGESGRDVEKSRSQQQG